MFVPRSASAARIARFARVSDCEYQHSFRSRVPPKERERGCSPVRDYQLAPRPSSAARPISGCRSQDHDRFPDALHRLKRVPRIPLGNELEDALQMPADCASAQPGPLPCLRSGPPGPLSARTRLEVVEDLRRVIRLVGALRTPCSAVAASAPKRRARFLPRGSLLDRFDDECVGGIFCCPRSASERVFSGHRGSSKARHSHGAIVTGKDWYYHGNTSGDFGQVVRILQEQKA